MKSIFYKYPFVYEWSIRFLYWDGLNILKNIIGRKKSVFEAASGYGRMKKYIYPDCSYSGIDLNETFIQYGRKKNRNITLGNIFDRNIYKKSDVILLCDILHHLKKKEMYDLVTIAAEFAREKIVIIEPVFVEIGAKDNFLSRFIGKVMKIIDADGFNEIERWLSKDEYHELFHSFTKINPIKEMSVRNHRNHDFVILTV